MDKVKYILAVLILTALGGCALPQPVPQWSVESCLRAHGTPVYTSDAWGNTEFRCIINDGRNSLNARYFNDSSMVEDLPPPPPHDGQQ